MKKINIKNLDGYDERQQTVNNIAYKHAFGFAMGITYLNGALVSFGITWAEPPMLFFLTFMLSFTFYTVDSCIFKIGLGKKFRKATPVATLGGAVFMLVIALYTNIIYEIEFINDWGLSWSGGSLAVSALALITFVCSIIEFVRERKANREGGE